MITIEFNDESFPSPCERPKSGNVQVLAWHRVCDALRTFGAVRDDEEITHIAVNERGLEVFTKKRKARIPEYLYVKRGR